MTTRSGAVHVRRPKEWLRRAGSGYQSSGPGAIRYLGKRRKPSRQRAGTKTVTVAYSAVEIEKRLDIRKAGLPAAWEVLHRAGACRWAEKTRSLKKERY
jgi:hypothetical protein